MIEQTDLLFTVRLEEVYGTLTNAEQKIADYMTAHLEDIPHMSAQKIAANSGTGPATVVRFCKSCGFSGLAELKMSLKRESIIPERLAGLDIKKTDSVSIIKQKALSYHIQTVENMFMEWNEESLEKAADAIQNANRIMVTGKGASRTSAYLFRDSCHLLGKECDFEPDQVDEFYRISNMNPGDVLVAFSYTGRLEDTVKTIKYAKERGVTVIAITGTADSIMTKYSDIVLYSSKSQKKYYFGAQNSVIGDFMLVEIIHTILATREENLAQITEELFDTIDQLRMDE